MSIEHTFKTKEGIVTKTITKAKAIRFHCLECSGQQQGEVTKCNVIYCALYPFRFGNEKGLERMYDSDKEKISDNVEDEELTDEDWDNVDWEDEDA